MFDKNVYKMTVVCCNYAVASYLPVFYFVQINMDGWMDGCFHPETAGECCIGKNTGGQRVTHA